VPIHADDRPSFEDCLSAYVEELAARNFSPATWKQGRCVLLRFFKFAKERGITDLQAFGSDDLIAYASALREQESRRGGKLSECARAAYLERVRAFFGFLSRRGLILRNPADGFMIPRSDRLPRRVLSQAEAQRLMTAPSAWTIMGLRDRAVLETLYGTGLRASECVRTDVTDVDLETGTLFVRNGKGKKDRVMPLPAQTRAALAAYLKDSRPELVRTRREAALFVSQEGVRLRATGLAYILEARSEDAGVPRVTMHALRHTYATHLLQGGADVRHVQKLLGHASLQSTTIYTRVAVADLRRVLTKRHPRERQRRREQSESSAAPNKGK
jgi:integrase/recombinase XerD